MTKFQRYSSAAFTADLKSLHTPGTKKKQKKRKKPREIMSEPFLYLYCELAIYKLKGKIIRRIYIYIF